VRSHAVESLAGDPDARDLLVSRLLPDECEVRIAAFAALARDPEGRVAVRARVGARGALIRAAAVGALGGDPESRELLRERLADENPFVRAAAVAALADDPDSRELIREVLHKEKSTVGAAAVHALGSDPEARPLLRACLEDDSWNVRVAAAEVLATDPEARPQLRLCLRDEDRDVRAAAVRALATDPDSQGTIQKLLGDLDAGVRVAATGMLAASPDARDTLLRLLGDASSAVRNAAASELRARRARTARALPLCSLPALRTARRLAGIEGAALGAEPDGAALREARLDAFLKAPSPLRLDADPEFATAILGWIGARLGCASRDGHLEGGRIYGEVEATCDVSSLLDTGDTLVIRVAMDAQALPAERLLHPLHNLMEALRVGRHLLAAHPPTFFLACADVDFEDLKPPLLEPGQGHWGPVFFGFRLQRAEVLPIEFAALLASTRSASLWDKATVEERARFTDALGRMAQDPDVDPWALVPVLARVGARLPEGIRAGLLARLPDGEREAALRLVEARAALGRAGS
jgi:HEAT repeat protein